MTGSRSRRTSCASPVAPAADPGTRKPGGDGADSAAVPTRCRGFYPLGVYDGRMDGHAHHGHHELPTSGRALTSVAVSATLHCLTGCALGEIAGMAIGTALGFSNWGTVAL